jgi:transaldolase
MKLFLDTADTAQWASVPGLPPIAGVTTNPSLVYQSGRPVNVTTYLALVQMAGAMRIKDLMVQMPRPDAGEVQTYLSELLPAAALAKVQLTIKLPCAPEWSDAIQTAQDHGVPVLLTGLSNAMQLMWAIDQGANWVAPYLGRLEDAGRDTWSLVYACIEAQRQGTQLLAASIRTPDVLARLMAAGSSAVTVRPELAKAWVRDSLTVQALEQFNLDILASEKR